MMKKSLLLLALSAMLLFLTAAGACCATNQLVARGGKDTIMVAVFAKPGAEDYTEYADGVLKERIKSLGFKIVNQEMAEKLKKDRLLLEAIKNANATAIARINSDFGAGIVVRATLQSVMSSEKLADSWEGLASISLLAIDTKTGEEIESVTSDPMGVSDNPSPIEESSLTAKQMAIRKAIDNLLLKMGASSEVISQTISIAPKFYAAYSEREAESLAFSPDSCLLAGCTREGVKIWDLNGKKLERTLNVKKAVSLAFSPDGTRLTALSASGDATVFSLPGGEVLRRLEEAADGKGVVAMSPDGEQVATGGGDGYIRVWDVASGRRLCEIKAHSDAIHSLSFDVSGKTVISASDDLTIRFWNVATRSEVKAFQEPMNRLNIAALNGDRSLIAYSSKTVEIDLLRKRRLDKRFIRLRETGSGKDISTFEGHGKDINALAFLPGKRFLVSGSDDKSVRIWDMEKRGEISNLEQSDRVTSVAVSRDGKWLAATSGEVVIWQLK